MMANCCPSLFFGTCSKDRAAPKQFSVPLNKLPLLIEEITEEMVENGNLETTKIHHHHFHHYDQESPSDMTQW